MWLAPECGQLVAGVIGLANVFSSLFAGYCVSHYKSKYVLAAMYGSRVVLVGIYLIAPRTEFDPITCLPRASASPGWPPCRPLQPWSASCSAPDTLATLFGLTLLSHQIRLFGGHGWEESPLRNSATIHGCGTPTWFWQPFCGDSQPAYSGRTCSPTRCITGLGAVLSR